MTDTVHRGYHAHVYTGPYHAPNEGISARVKHVTVVTVDGVPLVDSCPDRFALSQAGLDAPAVKVFKRGDRLVAHPIEPVPSGHVGYMASGAQIHLDDDLWDDLFGGRVVYLHDRTETQALCDVLSD
jgi:hypothetical protein